MTEYADELVTAATIARRMGITRQAIYKWTSAASFPEPVSGVVGSTVYRWQDVIEWKIKHTKQGWQ